MIRCFLGTFFLTRVPPPTTGRASITLSHVQWWIRFFLLLPWTSLGHPWLMLLRVVSDEYLTWKWKCCHSFMSNSLQPMDCIPSQSSVHGILQARILEWVAIPFSRADTKSVHLNPQKSSTTKQDMINWPGEMRWERGCECEERRIVLIRNKESHLCVVDLEIMERRMGLVSGTLPVGE